MVWVHYFFLYTQKPNSALELELEAEMLLSASLIIQKFSFPLAHSIKNVYSILFKKKIVRIKEYIKNLTNLKCIKLYQKKHNVI